jgi:hypothetical protein
MQLCPKLLFQNSLLLEPTMDWAFDLLLVVLMFHDFPLDPSLELLCTWLLIALLHCDFLKRLVLELLYPICHKHNAGSAWIFTHLLAQHLLWVQNLNISCYLYCCHSVLSKRHVSGENYDSIFPGWAASILYFLCSTFIPQTVAREKVLKLKPHQVIKF